MQYIYLLKNNITNRIYVGRTGRPELRFRQHISALKSNRHTNELMQQDFNMYGVDSFSMEIVEQSEPIPVVEEETPVEQHEVVPVSSPKKGNSFVKGLLLWSLIAILIASSIVVLGLAWYFAVVSAVAVMLIGLLLGFGIAIAKIALSLLPFVLALIIVIRILNNSKKPAPITKDDIDDDDDKTIVEVSGN